ncbi:MAG: dTDP-4-dehydrorhamnose 3,5-epimerase [Acholeplasmataceae bacterium]|jgi:dTDP-4-dehydrorhamnose 3,5-epimerase|nr:dTDP-4-dehydrorhamnose 3,5-epimerase [Acholeplasmataceae bacterium]
MKFIKTDIKDLVIVELNLHGDNRGWFTESYNYNEFKINNIHINFVQDNHSYSSNAGVLRGLHFQNNPYAQTKLVRCTKGRIWDVAVDLRQSSPTYLKWCGLELSSTNHRMLLVPKGFAHGFVTLESDCEVQYKVDSFYDKDADRSIRYDDPIINITWPIIEVIVSEKDKNAPLLKDSDVNFI